MESFRWDDCYVTGVGEVDTQHHGLIDLINRLGVVVTSASQASTSDIEEVFGELSRYAVYHFTEEEDLMLSRGLDRRFVDVHRQAHAAFIEEVTVMHAELATSGPRAADALLKFLAQWLAYHILGLDQRMARQIAAIERGETPERAYLATDRPPDPATNTLLHALDGLFNQVSERNRDLSLLNRTLEARVAERTQALSEANERLEAIAMTDALTGLPNRRHAMHCIEREWFVSDRDHLPLSCIMVDADHFKEINDAYGHDAGDAVLRRLARELRHALRTDDVVCRLGGDEFLVVCPNTPLAGAMQIAETLRREVSALRIAAGAGAGEWRGSISVGVAARTAAMICAEDIIKAADEGVFAAKREGRGRVATVQPH